MPHTLIQIYGPIAIHSYGLMIAIGLLAFILLLQKDPRFSLLRLENRFSGILLTGILAALIGGRLLFFATYPEQFTQFIDLLRFYEGGFSVLGAIVAVMLTVPAYLAYLQIPIVRFFDLIALYVPLLQSISRIGCLFAGCCYGKPTQMPWGVIYQDPECVAPLGQLLHPTQLYSAMSLLAIFAFFYFYLQHVFIKPGQMGSSYLIAIGIERFLIEYWRADTTGASIFTINQQVALSLIGIGVIGLIVATVRKK